MSQEGREAERPGSPWWPQAFFSRPLGTQGREATSSPFQSLISSHLFLCGRWGQAWRRKTCFLVFFLLYLTPSLGSIGFGVNWLSVKPEQ